jgi:hypothetical protein
MYVSLPRLWVGGYVGVCGVYLGRYIFFFNLFILFAYVICVCMYECIQARMYEGGYVSR